ncbi:MAG: IS1380 family transposase [Acidimicrobiales bacterium]
MKRSGRLARVKVTADGEGVVSHAGAELLRELAGHTGLIDAWDTALIGTYKAMPIHFPGSVLADLSVAIADGADSISDLKSLRDEPGLFGPVASTPTAWRVLDRVSAAHLPGLRAGRAAARAAAWAAGAAPDLSGELFLDLDATIVIAHSDKELASPTWKHTYGFHPLVCFLDRPEISSGEALSGIVREGRAGSNTTADHVCVLDMALANLPEHARPRPGDPGSPSYVARADAAGATYGFAKVCRDRGVGFSFGFAITQDVRDAISAVKEDAWTEAVESDDGTEVRDGAWVTEITEHLDLSAWPEGSRVIVRRERPHPGAQLSLFDEIEGLRHTAFITAPRSSHEHDERGVALLELRQRRHARIEDRIRQAKAAGLRNLPCKEAPENHAWLECVLAAADLVCWSKLLCFFDDPVIAHCEIAAFRYRVLHMAARLTRGGRVVHLRLDCTWAWAKQLALGFSRLRAAFA